MRSMITPTGCWRIATAATESGADCTLLDGGNGGLEHLTDRAFRVRQPRGLDKDVLATRDHSFHRGPGAVLSKYPFRRSTSSPHVELLHHGTKSLPAFQLPCVKRNTEPAPSGAIVSMERP